MTQATVVGTPANRSIATSNGNKTAQWLSQTLNANRKYLLIGAGNASNQQPTPGTPTLTGSTWSRTGYPEILGTSGKLVTVTAYECDVGGSALGPATLSWPWTVGGQQLGINCTLFEIQDADVVGATDTHTGSDALLADSNLQLGTVAAQSLVFAAAADWQPASVVSRDLEVDTRTDDIAAIEAGNYGTYVQHGPLAAGGSNINGQFDATTGTAIWNMIIFEVKGAAGGAAAPDYSHRLITRVAVMNAATR